MSAFFDGRSTANLKDRWAVLTSREHSDPVLASVPEVFQVPAETPLPAKNSSEVGPSAHVQRDGGNKLIHLPGLERTAEEWDSKENQFFRSELRKYFPNNPADYW
jgi:hypothetical protein